VTARPGLAVVATLAATTLVGCGVQSPSPAKTLGEEYVALGDSYAAAPGVAPADGDDGCFRSLANYPHLVAESTGLDLVDVTCSGATTDAIADRQRTLVGTWREPQLDALSRGTDLVTLGIGGNDLGFYIELTNTCVVLAADNRAGSPCQDADDQRPADERLAARLAELEEREVAVLDKIQDRAPNARVLVVGYPAIVPEREACAEIPVAAGDVAYLSRIVRGLNQALSTAARRAGADYVDLYERTRGHDICGADPWIAGVTPVRGVTTAWHPYPAEQRAAADAIEDVLDDD